MGEQAIPTAEEHGFVLEPSSPNDELLLEEVLVIHCSSAPQSVKPSDHLPAELENEAEIFISLKSQT